MRIHDISVTTCPETVTWDGTERGFAQEWLARIGADSDANVSLLTLGAHTGTHLDAPLHFIQDGISVEALDLGALVGPAQVVEIYGRDAITAADLDGAGLAPGVERVIFKTDNTQRGLLTDGQFHRDYVGVAPSGASWLVARGVRLVGMDYLSVGPYGQANVETHRILLSAGVVLVETLRLDDVQAGDYTLVALPPKFAGVEGCPCRAILMEG